MSTELTQERPFRAGVGTPGADLLSAVAKASREVIAPSAGSVDRENRFPSESIGALRSLGLFRYGLPSELSGWNWDFREFCRMAACIGESCLSTAIIWSMHCQQLATLTGSSFADRHSVLEHIARDQCLVASVTTELQKGGDLLRTRAPLVRKESEISIQRHAPIVSCGRDAEYFLMTMRGGERENSTCLVLVARNDGCIREDRALKLMGMRGTQSIAMSFDLTVSTDRVLAGDFQELAVRYMIPVGHLGWAASWFGAAKGLFHRVIHTLRREAAGGRRALDSELLRLRLGEARSHLDMVEALIDTAADRLQAARDQAATATAYQDPTLNMLVNNVKVAASRHCFLVADLLMELSGLFAGYLEDSETGLERVFRDLRSATMMFKNERLLDANGRLAMLERRRLFST